jgi:hypothetical protein
MANWDAARAIALDRIRQNIAQHGFHTYIVTGGGDPHYAYTIGLSHSLGGEIILAGAYYYSLDELPKIIEKLVSEFKPADWESKVDLGPWGTFSFREAHMSWTKTLMLGALDFFQVKEIKAFQIVPDDAHVTVEVPNLSEPWSPSTSPAWRGLHEEWTYPIPLKSVGLTNLDALRGERITEVMRWEEDEWELFAGAGPDVAEEDRRVVPLGILLAWDKSLIPIVNLQIGRGLWRDDTSEWRSWCTRENSGGVSNTPTEH